MTRMEAIELSGYWPRLARLAYENPQDARGICAAFRDMRAEGCAGSVLDSVMDEALGL
ncbi:hypothetical protein [Kitasatospora sp. McL0602]|uniref:hypothetical protein n=1 Tax=Kitasatospora sp. McL0602 TaxID=3439530 RepID=UPI003F89B086